MKKLLAFCFVIQCLTVAAQPQNGFDFDGVDDYISQTNGSASLVGKTSFSMACWVYPTNANPGFPDFDGIIGYRNESNADFFILQLGVTNFEARMRNSSGTAFTITSPTCQLNQWQHLALVYTGSQLRFYHNGMLSQSIAASGQISNATVPFNIGRIPFQTTPFWLQGQVDEVGIWGRALSDSEVNCIYRQKLDTSMLDLLHYFPMDEGVAGGNNFSLPHLTDTKSGLHGQFFGTNLNGATSNFVTGTQQAGQATASICQGGTYSLFGQTFTQPGSYRVQSSGDGCDSTVFLTITLDTLDVRVVQNREILTAQNTAATAYRWLNCQQNYAPVTGATSATFNATENGSYALEITENGCVDTSICYQVNTVSVHGLESFQIRLYPNPASNYLTLETQGNHDELHVKITNIQGQEVNYQSNRVAETRTQWDVSTWPAGTYCMTVVGKNGLKQISWIKTP